MLDLMLDPSLFFVVDDLLQAKICNCLFVQLDLLFIFEVQKPILRNNNIAIDCNAIVSVMLLFGVTFLVCICFLFVFKAEMSSNVLVQPIEVVVVFLLHKTFFNDDCEDVGDYTN